MPQKSVTIYSTPTCHFCKQAKEFFTEKGIQYTNYDVSVDTAKRAEMIKLTGQLGVPVIVIGGEVVIGFSRGKVAEKLGIDQGAVSKIERRTDMYLSTLRNVIQALGGQLELTACFPTGRVQVLTFLDVERPGKKVRKRRTSRVVQRTSMQ